MSMKNKIAKFEPGKFYKIEFPSFTGKAPIYRIVRLVKRKRNRLYFEGYWYYCGVICKISLERTVRFSNAESEGCYYVNKRIPLLPVTYANEALCRKPKWWDSCKKEVGR